jgi:hypothetical protein
MGFDSNNSVLEDKQLNDNENLYKTAIEDEYNDNHMGRYQSGVRDTF